MTPPKSTLPVRSHSVFSRTSMILPGIARHMRFLPVIAGGHNLTEGDATVARRNALMPVWRKSFLRQAFPRAFEQTPIEKTAAGQDHTPLANTPGHGANCFDQARMKPRR